jgi:hypothetical protein
LRRDLRNVTEHLARFDARLLRFADCGSALFRHFVRGTLDQATGPEAGLPPAGGAAVVETRSVAERVGKRGTALTRGGHVAMPSA